MTHSDRSIQGLTQELACGEGQSSRSPEGLPVREVVQVSSEDVGDGVHIEVTALPASGRPATPPTEVTAALQSLSTSDTWHFSTEQERKQGSEQELRPSTEQRQRPSTEPRPRPSSVGQAGARQPDSYRGLHTEPRLISDKKRPYSAFDSRTASSWARSIVKPDTYCFDCIPEETMSTKVGRQAGRMPGGPQTHAGQVLRMSRRQNEYFKKAPPLRTAPSIPSTSKMALQSPRQGQLYSAELEHHARKVNSPRHFMEQG